MSQTTPEASRESSTNTRPFFVIWTGQAVSLVGSYAVQFALIWWITLETDSAAMLSLAALLGLAPAVLLGPLLGAAVDRWSRKAIMVLADGAVAVASLVLAVGFAQGWAGLYWVLVALLVRGIGTALHQPAMAASTTLMVPPEHLTRIQGLNQMLQGGLVIVGAPLGALLVAFLSMEQVMLVDVASALIAIVPLLFVRVPQPPKSESDDASETLLGQTVEGIRYLRKSRGHLALLALIAWVNLLLGPAFSLLPLFVREHLAGGAMLLGGLQSVLGLGLLAGGIALGVWGGLPSRLATALWALGLMGLGVIGLGMLPAGSRTLAFAAIATVGFLVPLINGPIQALLQLTVPPDFQGRVFALWGSLAAGMAPLGLVLAGPYAEAFGLRSMYVIAGISCVIVAAIAYGLPQVRRIEADVPVAAASAEGAVEPAGSASAS